MHQDTHVRAVIALLSTRIADDTSALNTLRGLVPPDAPPPDAAPSERSARPKTGRTPKGAVGKAAVEILRATGRPMHGLREIVPALRTQGFSLENPSGFATTLLRTNEILRVAPGTFALTGGAGATDER